MDAYEFAQKYRRLGAVIEKRKKGDFWYAVVFLKRCPKCRAALPGMLTADGLEACIKCDYQRLPHKFFI